jgi:CobQ-like glutamine amidotransferase family enzyme
MVIELIYPQLCQLYGDAANAELLQRAMPDASVARTPPGKRPSFLDGGVDLVYMGSMTENGQAAAARALAPYRDEIERCIDDGVRFLVTGNAVELFGSHIDCGDDERLECLGIFDAWAKRDMSRRYNGLFLGKYGDIDIVGFMSRFSHLYCNAPAAPEALFEVVRGAGRRPGEGVEGLRRNNFTATYTLGPLLILNPPFTKRLLRDMGAHNAEIPFERAAMEAYEARLQEFSDPKTGFIY